MQRKTLFWIAMMVGLVALGLALAACTSGVSQKDYDAVKQQVAAKEQELAKAKQDLQAAQAAGPAATALQQQLTKAQQDLQAAQEKAKTSVLGVNLNAKPIFTPTPRPPGPTPTPAPPVQPPAARIVPLFFYVDTVTAAAGESKYNVDATYGCIRTGIFKRGQRIVWRMDVVDTSTGKVLQGADVQSAVLKLLNGESLTLRYGRHGRTDDSPWFWAVGWDVPPDFPLGSLDYTIEIVTKDGKTGTFQESTRWLLPGFVDLLQTTRPDPDRWKMTNGGLTIVP